MSTDTPLTATEHATTQDQWTAALTAKAERLRLVALDVDGVLTDGGLYYDDAGHELKRFFCRDGLGLRLLLEAGIAVGLITARHSALVARRADELGLTFCRQGADDKWRILQEEIARLAITPAECAYMGDDLVDLPVLANVGLATAPADAHPRVTSRVHWVASRNGGYGAVRELADAILQAKTGGNHP